MQPKLNGIRMMALNGVLMSRDGLVWKDHCLTHIREALSLLPKDKVFDGELYCHGLSLQEINSRIAVVRQDPHPEELNISYHIFDYVSLEPFFERSAHLHRWLHAAQQQCSHLLPIKWVHTHFAPTYESAHAFFRLCQAERYEGAMFRDPLSPYSLPSTCSNKENRTPWLLKKKDWEDMDALILAVLEGEGWASGTCGSLLLRTPEGVEFKAGSGLDLLQRDKLWSLRHEIESLSWIAKIRYEMLSLSRVPLKPTIILLPSLP